MTEDMVAEGVVPSLAHPGGNITGVSLLSPELDTKRQEILIEAVPGARKIAAMADANATPEYHLQALEHAARSRGVELSVFRVGGSGEITSAIDAAKASGAEALNFLATPLFSVPGSQSNRVVLDRVAAVRLPSIFQFSETAEAGALAPAMEHGLPICTVSGRESRCKCFAAPSLVTFRCSNRINSSWLSI